MRKSWVWGAATVILVHVVWFALILTQAHADWVMGGIIVMLFVTMNIAGLGAFITSYGSAPPPAAGPHHGAPDGRARHRLEPVAGIDRNPCEFAGFRGNVGLLAVSLAYGIFVSAVGGGLGAWLARRRTRRAPPPPLSESPAAADSRPAAPPSRHLTTSPFARADR
jgi:hypothetical protein